MRELAAMGEAAAKSDKLLFRRGLHHAWQNAVWGRSRKMPSWDKVAEKLDRSAEPLPKEDLLAKAKAIHAALGGKPLGE